MSQTDQQPQQQPPQEQDKSMDKKEIAEEEREKMLNAENTKHSGAAPAPDLEADEHKPKRKIPIGGIKMPGFCRSKSKEPRIDEEDTKPNESADGENGPANNKDAAGDNGVAANDKSAPAKEPKEKEARRGIIEAIRVPLSNVSSVFSRKKKEADAELGTTGAAGLASVETLDDNAQEKNNAATEEDAMDSVRLDAEAGDAPTKNHFYLNFILALRRNLISSAVLLLILLGVILIIAIACAGPRREQPSPVKDNKVIAVAQCGLVEGLVEEGAYVFRGIPYAVPPVNERRFKYSELINQLKYCWNGTYLAHNASNVCWQRNETHIYGNEDCLTLDIFTTSVRQENPKAVVVMIGADTLSGPSPGVMIPSGQLARVRGVVYVRPNFRLDAFGFLAVEPLSRAANPPSSGNYGLSDIINVLTWVQENIANFGGDPKLVTLWGHRAGGTLVSALVGTNKANKLFSRAWISSGSVAFPTSELRVSEKANQPFLDNIRCNDASCLRSRKAEEIMNAVPPAWYAPNDGMPQPSEITSKKHEWLVKDDVIIKLHIGDIFKENNSTVPLPVKVVMGTTAYSGRLPESIKNTNLTKAQVKNLISYSLFGRMGVVDDAMQLYFEDSNQNSTQNKTTKEHLLTQTKTPKELLHMMISDVRVVCPLHSLATSRSDLPFYISNFTSNVNLTVDSDAAAILGFFPNVTEKQKRHLQAIQQLFNHFVWNGEVQHFNAIHRVLYVDQDVNGQAAHEKCKLWTSQGIVPAYARVD